MNKIVYIIIGFATLMISCQSDDLNDSLEIGNPSVAHMGDSNLQRASAKALDFVAPLQNESRFSGANISVASVYAWRLCDILPQTRLESGATSDTLLYIVNFDNNNGFVLVSASEKYDDVVAYVENGNLRPTDEIDNPGFQMFVDCVASQLSDPLFPGYVHNDSVQPGPFPRPDVWQTTAFYQPLLSTAWGQEDPFNRLCYTPDSILAVAGCGAIAVSQIVAYHQHPSAYQTHTYLWNDILSGNTPQTESGKTSVSELVYDVGHLIRTEYGVSASTSYTDSISYCWNEFGYSYSLMDFNIDSCLVDFQNNRPVFMRGTGLIEFPDRIRVFGHAWVIDGCVVREREIITLQPPGSQNEIQHFIHCNWGWDGEYDGYYIAGAFGTKYDQNGENPTTAYPFYNLLLRTYNNIYPLNP